MFKVVARLACLLFAHDKRFSLSAKAPAAAFHRHNSSVMRLSGEPELRPIHLFAQSTSNGAPIPEGPNPYRALRQPPILAAAFGCLAKSALRRAGALH